MGEWWKILLSLTVSGTALAVLTAGLIRLLRGRVPCRWLCGLWLLVLLRFLCPLGTQFGLIPGMMSSPAVHVLVVDLAEEGAQGEAGIPPQQPSVPSGGNPGHVPLSLAAAAVWGAGAAAVLGGPPAGLPQAPAQSGGGAAAPSAVGAGPVSGADGRAGDGCPG